MSPEYLIVILEKPAARKGEDFPQLGLGLARLDQLTSAPSKKKTKIYLINKKQEDNKRF
jgi:hypothetical protein